MSTWLATHAELPAKSLESRPPAGPFPRLLVGWRCEPALDSTSEPACRTCSPHVKRSSCRIRGESHPYFGGAALRSCLVLAADASNRITMVQAPAKRLPRA